MARPRATVAFVPREVFSTTQRSLEALFERTHEPFDLVCIDGHSPPAVRDYLERQARERQFTLVRTDGYVTPNQARNLAARHVTTPYVVFIDNDVLVTEGWLSALVDCAEQTGAWVVGPLYFEFLPEGRRLHMFGGDCKITTNAAGERVYYERHHLTVMNAGRTIWLEPSSQITYAPPKRLEPEDEDFFLLRWSEAWADATHRRIDEKWNLTPDNSETTRACRWVADHRRYRLVWLNKLRKWIGPKWAKTFEKRFVAPWESLQNRRRYPLRDFSRAPRVNSTVVYAPGRYNVAA
jgi:glycosyltransferase involved in cell wall biosynthesis